MTNQMIFIDQIFLNDTLIQIKHDDHNRFFRTAKLGTTKKKYSKQNLTNILVCQPNPMQNEIALP